MNKQRFLLFFSLVFLLSSCSVVNNFSFEKRKYRPGFYINGNQSEQENKITSVKMESEQNVIEKIKEQPVRENQKAEKQETTIDEKITLVPKLISNKFQSNKIENSIEDKIALSKQLIKPNPKKENAKEDGLIHLEWEVVLGTVLILAITLLYTFQILAENPGMPFALAFFIGLLLTGLSILTGEFFIW